MKKMVGIFCTALAGGLFAADGTWIVTSGTLNYTDTANWKDGVVAGDGGTLTVTNTAATTVNLDGSVTLGKIVGVVNNFFYFNLFFLDILIGLSNFFCNYFVCNT